jgi:hypothetical protein
MIQYLCAELLEQPQQGQDTALEGTFACGSTTPSEEVISDPQRML